VHEFAIAQSVLEVVTRHAGERRVVRVALRVGHLRQVVAGSLQFAFELAARGTPADGAEVSIKELPAVGRCRSCGLETELRDFPFQCGRCESLDLELTQGEELLVESLELEEAAACTARP
jgi:hydrogenase nickel incorporation protein HypA/HybF